MSLSTSCTYAGVYSYSTLLLLLLLLLLMLLRLTSVGRRTETHRGLSERMPQGGLGLGAWCTTEAANASSLDAHTQLEAFLEKASAAGKQSSSSRGQFAILATLQRGVATFR